MIRHLASLCVAPRATLATVCLVVVLATAALAPGAARAELVLQHVGEVVTPPAAHAVPWSTHRTLVTTDRDVRLINWLADPGPDREPVLFSLPAAPVGVDTWADSVLVRMDGQPPLLVRRDGEAATPPEEMPAGYRLPNTLLGGESYRVEIDSDLYLLIYSAPGSGQIVGLLDFQDTVGPGSLAAQAGERAALAIDQGVWIASLENPLLPAFTVMIEPPVAGWTPTAMAMRDQVLFIHWTNRIQAWDLTNPYSPALLDEIASDGFSLHAGERWLATWQPGQRGIAILDAADPTALASRAVVDVFADQVLIQADRLLTDHADQLLAHRIPAQGGPVAEGPAVQILDGTLLASDGDAAWLQSGATRHVVDLGGHRLVAPQTLASDPGDWRRHQFHVVGDHLLHLRAGEGLDILDLAVPEAPALVTTLDHTPAPQASDTDGTLLAVADGQAVTLYDLADATSPVERGSLPLAGTPQCVRVRDGVAAVLTGHLGTSEEGLVHLVDVSLPDQPQLLATLDAAPEGEDLAWQASQASWHGPTLRVLCWRWGTIDPVASTLTIDLADPQAPVATHSTDHAGQWCYQADDFPDPVLAPSDAPLSLAGLHVSYAADTLTVYRDPGGVADLEPAATWAAPGPIEEIARVGNRLLVLGHQRLDILTVSDDGLVDVPDLAVNDGVRAAPNPFNPRTTLHFSMPAAGRATAAIHDARGRRVRTLAADLPAGPAALRWDGAGDQGRALPSGTYLVRVITASGVQTGRCQLVR